MLSTSRKLLLTGIMNDLFKSVFLAILLAKFGYALDDQFIYIDNAIASPWQDWSWGSTINYAATDVKEDVSSMSVSSAAWSALSLYTPTSFSGYAGLKFDISGDQPDFSLQIQDTAAGTSSPSIPLSALSSTVTSSGFTSVLLDFNNIPPNGAVLGAGNWDRLTFQGGANGAVYHLDNLELISEIVIKPEFLSAEPLANNIIALTTKGAVDLTTVSVTLNGKKLAIASNSSLVPVDTPAKSITYLTLATSLAAGNLSIAAGTSSFNYVLPAYQSTTLNLSGSHPISDLIYGINFPTDASYIQNLGVTVSRWGGNAVTAYNPFGGFTNAGNDWYFENRASDSADDWVGWVNGAGSKSALTVPALDWVSKDATSYSYPKTTYPDQKAFDPYNANAGDGIYANGSYASPPPDPNSVYVPWNTTIAKTWLLGLKNKPTIVHIDNEMEIASNTHQDMHPAPMGYDEELSRVVNYSIMAKQALPNVQVAAPSTCAWWFYWTSSIGYTDNAAHNNTDWLPWFLGQMKTAEKTAGKRLLDYLDLHFYYQADTSANDDAAKALRLRMTRGLWDPTYVDESWVGTSTPQNHQPNATIMQFVPRIKSLITQFYPGTKLSIGEWSSTADSDITGGLVTVDALGIYGRYGVDSATYWASPDKTSPVGLAYWLFRGYGKYFGNVALGVQVNGFNPNVLGVYAANRAVGTKIATSLVVVNKDPKNPVALSVSGLPTGTYLLRHFGGQAGVAKFQATIALHSASYIVVPAYTALFLGQQV